MIRRASLRKGIWSGDSAHPLDVGELARDMDTRLRSMAGQYRALRMVDWTYAPPIVIDNAGVVPLAILVGQVRTPGATANTVIATQPNWDVTGTNPRINSIGGLTVGVKYDITLLIFG